MTSNNYNIDCHPEIRKRDVYNSQTDCSRLWDDIIIILEIVMVKRNRNTYISSKRYTPLNCSLRRKSKYKEETSIRSWGRIFFTKWRNVKSNIHTKPLKNFTLHNFYCTILTIIKKIIYTITWGWFSSEKIERKGYIRICAHCAKLDITKSLLTFFSRGTPWSEGTAIPVLDFHIYKVNSHGTCLPQRIWGFWHPSALNSFFMVKVTKWKFTVLPNS